LEKLRSIAAKFVIEKGPVKNKIENKKKIRGKLREVMSLE
jgi:hypothetical protein